MGCEPGEGRKFEGGKVGGQKGGWGDSSTLTFSLLSIIVPNMKWEYRLV